MVDLEDIGEKKAFCRCWKSEKVRVVWCGKLETSSCRKNDWFWDKGGVSSSKSRPVGNDWFWWKRGVLVNVDLLQWPYCDGSHGKHNKETGDNVGPVVIKKKEWLSIDWSTTVIPYRTPLVDTSLLVIKMASNAFVLFSPVM